METLTTKQQEQLAEMKLALDLWYRRVVSDKPDLDSGSCASIEFEGGASGTWKDDEPMFVFSLVTEQSADNRF